MTLENTLQLTLHDLMTPLKSLMKKYTLKPDGLFDRFSKDKRYLSMADLKEIFRSFLKIELTDQESDLLQSAISGFFGKTDGLIDKNQFINLISRDFVIKSFA